MPSNKDKTEQVSSLLSQAKALLASIESEAPQKSKADYFIPTLAANVDNKKLTDAEFRDFVRNSLQAL